MKNDDENTPAGSDCQERLVRQSCNHVWREGPSCAALESKDALMTAIAGSKSAGRWLRGEEIAWGKELEAEGKVTLCCDGRAATSLPNNLLPIENGEYHADKSENLQK